MLLKAVYLCKFHLSFLPGTSCPEAKNRVGELLEDKGGAAGGKEQVAQESSCPPYMKPETQASGDASRPFSLSCHSATPRTVALQAPLTMGFPRREDWSGLPCPPPGDLLNPGIKTTSPVSPAVAGRFRWLLYCILPSCSHSEVGLVKRFPVN